MNRYTFFVGLFAAAAVYGLLTLWTSRNSAVRPSTPPAPTVVARAISAPLTPIVDAPRGPTSAATVPVKRESANEKIARIQATKDTPELRELRARRIIGDYLPLFERLRFSVEKQNLLVSIWLDQLAAMSRAERDDYEKLTAQMLSADEYAELKNYRAELAIKSTASSALEVLKYVGGDPRPDREAIVTAVMRAAPISTDSLWLDADRREAAGTLSVGDLAGLAALAAQRFETALNQNAVALTAKEKQALRIWFQGSVIDSRVDEIRKRLAPGGG
jgi:hypothetical protein